MASSHSSSPVPHPRGGGGNDGIYRKDKEPSSRHYRPVRSLPDVCPKEPTGRWTQLRLHLLSIALPLTTGPASWVSYVKAVDFTFHVLEAFVEKKGVIFCTVCSQLWIVMMLTSFLFMYCCSPLFCIVCLSLLSKDNGPHSRTQLRRI